MECITVDDYRLAEIDWQEYGQYVDDMRRIRYDLYDRDPEPHDLEPEREVIMARDPLEQFKRRPVQQNTGQPSQPPASPPVQPQTAAAPAAPSLIDGEELDPPRQFDPRTGKEVYTPFHISSRRRDRLEIRPETGPWLFPRYFDMADMIVNRRIGTEIVLQFPAYAVYIDGRGLQQLVYALKEGRCSYIEAYDPETFAPVADEDKAPFIKSIAIVLKNKPSDAEPPGEPKRVKLH